MAYLLKVKQEAEEDLRDGYLWFESKSKGLGERFLEEVEQVTQYISEYPHHFQIKYKNYREALLPHFPYLVIFEIFKDEVVVFSIFPALRDPNAKVD